MLKTLPELFKSTAEKYATNPSFLTREIIQNTEKGKRKKTIAYNGPTWKELYEMGLDLATALSDLGIKKGDHIGLLADNRLEWIIADYAVQLCGAADVPRGTDITDSEISYILNHSESVITFVEHEKMLTKVQQVKDDLETVKTIIVMDKKFQERDGILSLHSLLEKGKKLRAEGDNFIEENIKNIKEHDVFTLIYTSGTTGAPKGVMLTHSNMMSQALNLSAVLNCEPEDKALSILPVWHVFERVVEYIFVALGASTTYTSIRYLGEDMKTCKPTFMASAPRVWESVYLKISDKVSSGSIIKRGLFKAAVTSASGIRGSIRFFKGNDLQLQSQGITRIFSWLANFLKFSLLLVPFVLLDFIVLKKLRSATGGKLKGTVSGGGALPLHIDLFFNNIGIPVLEGYGMTETSPVIAVRTFENLVPGTVGPLAPLTSVEIRDEKGESRGPGIQGVIWVKGPQVMKGYYKNDEATNKVLIDNWMNTGDVGLMTFNECLKITGRAKDTIVLFSGENVEPGPIENQLSKSSYIEHVMVTGQDAKFLGALIYVAEDRLLQWADQKDIKASYSELIQNEEVLKLIRAEIKSQVNAGMGFKSFEKISDFRLLPKPFEVGDELTNIFKLKRHVVNKKYANLIEEIHKS